MSKHDTSSLVVYSGYRHIWLGLVYCGNLLHCRCFCVPGQIFHFLASSCRFCWWGFLLPLIFWQGLHLALYHLDGSLLLLGLGFLQDLVDGRGWGLISLWTEVALWDFQTVSCWGELCHRGNGWCHCCVVTQMSADKLMFCFCTLGHNG